MIWSLYGSQDQHLAYFIMVAESLEDNSFVTHLCPQSSHYIISQSVLHVGDGSLIKLNILHPELRFGDKRTRQWDMHAPA
jgi:hypothetical protein